MAIVKKTVPYEILIRFGFGGDHQTCTPGEFSGAHYRTADLIVDDATGEVIAAPSIGHAQDVPQAQLAALVGEQMAAINAGVDALKVQLADAQAKVETQAADIAAKDAALADHAASIEALRGQLADAQAQVEAQAPASEARSAASAAPQAARTRKAARPAGRVPVRPTGS